MTILDADSSHCGWPNQFFITEPSFVPPVLEFNKTGETSPGLWFIDPASYTNGFIMDDYGEMIYSAPVNENPIQNFSPQWLNGEHVIVYHETHSGNSEFILAYGNIVILDDTYNVKHNVTLNPPEIQSPLTPGGILSKIDMHECYISQDNTLLVVAYNATPTDLTPLGGPKDGWVRDCLLIEMDIVTSEILFQWKMMDTISYTKSHADLSGKNGRGTKRTNSFDAYHLNSIQDFEGGYVISIRHTFQVVFLDRETGEIMWVLDAQDGGDFDLDQVGLFAWQHHAMLHRDPETEGLVLTLHDNGNNDKSDELAPSRGIMLDLDLERMTATTRKIYQDPDRLLYAKNSGSVTWNYDDSHVIVNYGSSGSLQEFDANGDVVYSMRFSQDQCGWSYRAFKSEWKGYPTTIPSVKACNNPQDGSVLVYMSWNGATEVTSWRVYASNEQVLDTNSTTTAEHDLQWLGTVKKTGFETRMVLEPHDVTYVQVEAVGGRTPSDTKLSDIVPVLATCRDEMISTTTGQLIEQTSYEPTDGTNVTSIDEAGYKVDESDSITSTEDAIEESTPEDEQDLPEESEELRDSSSYETVGSLDIAEGDTGMP